MVLANPTPLLESAGLPPVTRPDTSVRNCRMVSGRRLGLRSMAFMRTRSISALRPGARKLGGTGVPRRICSSTAAVSAPSAGGWPVSMKVKIAPKL